MMKSMQRISLWIFLAACSLSFAQPTLNIHEAMFLNLAGQQRRAAIAIDPVEAQIVSGTFKPPVAQQKIPMAPGDTAAWQPISADSTGWFTHRALRGGWVYGTLRLNAAGAYLLEGMGHNMVYVNGVPRIGNRYRARDDFESWEPRFDYGVVPVRLNRGDNHFLFRCSRGRLKVLLHPVTAAAVLNPKDVTLPDLRRDETLQAWGAIPVLNTTDEKLQGLLLSGSAPGVRLPETPLPELQPLSLRKVPFRIEASAASEAGPVAVEVTLSRRVNGVTHFLDRCRIVLNRVEEGAPFRCTFISQIDGSVQYYAVNPATSQESRPSALFLSLHGANVEGINQAGSYAAKSWGHIVSPTNRRPYGHNWEDWGRIDALEVLALAKSTLNIDSSRIYLTGHSMGGHGTWIFSATYPDQFAAIGPSAGWISFWSYGARASAVDTLPVARLFERAGNISNTLALASNYQRHGVYIIHGSADDNVPIQQAELMIDHIKDFHKDYLFHAQPEAGHWWDLSDEPGADCVDWPPLFDFFARHARPGAERQRQVDFTTANPGVSARCDWLTIAAQHRSLELSRATIQYDPGSGRFSGTTANVALLALRPQSAASANNHLVRIDGDSLRLPAATTLWLEQRDGHWHPGAAPAPQQKSPHRYGPFKEAFQHRMLFVYGTLGSTAENQWARDKARFDAESFWYQSNGSVEVIADDDFDPIRHKDRSVILYGNARSNGAWRTLLPDCPIRVLPGRVEVGEKSFRGTDLACLFVYPRRDSESACVAAVAASGLPGMRLTTNLPYLYAGTAFPDFSLFNSDILRQPGAGLLAAGFFDRNWRLSQDETALHAGLKNNR